MKKVRLFAVAAAMGMFASSVSAATQIGPVTTKTSGSFAWGEFASVMKVDMGDKVVAPQVTVTATTEGRTTDIDYATYKTATGLVKNSTCYVGFTNTVAKDTNIDGLVDMPFYVTNAKKDANGKYIAYASTDAVAHAIANYGADTLFGTVVLAPGQGEIDEIYHVAGTEKTFTELTEVFDYLEEEGYFEVTYADDIIKTVSFATHTFYMIDKDGNEIESQPLGTLSATYVNSSKRAKDTEAIKEDLATLYSNATAAKKLDALKDLETMETGLAATVTDTDKANYDKVFKTVYTRTTGSEFDSSDSAADVNFDHTNNGGVISATNPYYEDYAFYPETEYYKGELLPTANATSVSAADIQSYGYALVVEYDSKYEMYIPDATKTTALNTEVQTWVDAFLGNTTSPVADIKAVLTAKGDTYAAAVAAKSSDATIKTKTTASDVNALLTSNAIAKQLVADYFYGTYGLDFHPVPATQTVKDTFVNPGFVSVIEYDASARRVSDYSVLLAPKKEAKITKQYQTIMVNTYDAESVSFVASPIVELVSNGVEFANGTSSIDEAEHRAKHAYYSYASSDTYEDIYYELYSAGTIYGVVKKESSPENDTDYIVINYPIAGGNNTVTPVSRSITKMTANYANPVTGEEIMTHLVELDANDGTRGDLYYPAVETEEDAIKFIETVKGVVSSVSPVSPITNYTNSASNDLAKAKFTWADGTSEKIYINSALSSPATTQCTYSTNKGSDVKTEAASVSFDASKVDTTKAGVYTATLTAKAGETTETKDVTVVVAPKYSRTWDNKGRVSTLKAYWLSGNLYAEYKYTYNADNTITVVSTFYREDGVTVADTATTTK